MGALGPERPDMVDEPGALGPSPTAPLWSDSFFPLRANLANKVLLEQVVNVVPLVPWAPLD